jgi:CBS domain-containing protein
VNQTSLHVRDVMSKTFFSILPDADIALAVSEMIRHDVSGLLVVDSANALVGILTERDCIAAASAAAYYQEWGGPVSRFMSAPVETVAPDDRLIDVAAMMGTSRYRRFPVVDGARIEGLLTRRDVLGAIGDGSHWSG